MIDLPSIYFGLFLGIFPFTVAKVVQQSRKIVARSRTFRNVYLYMIWVEAVVNFVFAIITYLYIIGVIPGRRVLYPPFPQGSDDQTNKETQQSLLFSWNR